MVVKHIMDISASHQLGTVKVKDVGRSCGFTPQSQTTPMWVSHSVTVREWQEAVKVPYFNHGWGESIGMGKKIKTDKYILYNTSISISLYLYIYLYIYIYIYVCNYIYIYIMYVCLGMNWAELDMHSRSEPSQTCSPMRCAPKKVAAIGHPVGKHTKNDGKSPFLMGKSTIYKWPFS